LKAFPGTGHAIRLEAGAHQAAADHFFRHFGIRRRPAALGLIEEIIRRFSALPYENISKIIKLNRCFDDAGKIRLPDEVMSDHIAHNLGGTCFSLTFLLESILKRAGFSCFPVMADMRAGPAIHCALVAEVEARPHLVDPGYLLGRPVPLDREQPQILRTDISGAELRYGRRDGRFHLFTFNKEARIWRYRFLPRPVAEAEFLRHWHRSFTRPGMHNIALSALRENRLVFIRKNYMRETSYRGKQSRNIRKDYARVIDELFGIPEDLLKRARSALEDNLEKERRAGIFRPARREGRL
jgi:arylamine N-acetyltransferase